MNRQLLGENTTLRFACRRGDYLAFARFRGVLASEGEQYDLMEVWQPIDGDQVLLTTRYQDLPEWLELHPFETCGDAARGMQMRLEGGHTPPDEPVDAVNLIRVRAGDRLLWLGESRPDMVSDAGILAIVEIQNDAAIVGEPLKLSDDGMPHFGAFLEESPPGDVHRFRSAWMRMSRLSAPRVASTSGWCIGS